MKLKIVAYLVALLFGAAALADFVYLRGDKVHSAHGKLLETTTVTVPVRTAGEPHRLIISTGRSNREDYEIALAWSLHSPDGTELKSDNELAPYRTRSFTFVPEQTGDYRLSLSPKFSTAGIVNRLTQEDRYSLSVLLNDKSIIFPLLQSAPL